MVYVSTTFAGLNSKVSGVVKQLERIGVRNIELGSIHCHEPQVESFLTTCSSDFLVHNYFPPPADPFIVNLASDDPRIRSRSLRHVLESISFCRRIGAKLYTFHPGFVREPIGASTSADNYDFRFHHSGGFDAKCHEASFERFLDAASRIVEHASQLGVRVAVESEGSVGKRHLLLLQREEEFDRLLGSIENPMLGINLNLGHLNLAANAFGFDRFKLIDKLSQRIVAMEISHNEGVEDDHRPLVPGAWYWDVVRDRRFDHVPIILETRDTSLEVICETVRGLETERRAGNRPFV